MKLNLEKNTISWLIDQDIIIEVKPSVILKQVQTFPAACCYWRDFSLEIGKINYEQMEFK